MSGSFKERRKHARYEHGFLLFFYVKGNKDVTYEMSQVNNISLSGINFSSCKSLPKGTTVCVELKTPFTDKNIEIEGVLLECVEVAEGTIYRMRLEFKDIPGQTLDLLKKIESF